MRRTQTSMAAPHRPWAGLDGPAVPIRVEPVRLPEVEPAVEPAPVVDPSTEPVEVPAA